jgi:hypothetical protein
MSKTVKVSEIVSILVVETDFSYFIKIDPGKTAVVFVLSGYGKREERI